MTGKRRDTYMDIFKRLRREKEEIKTEQQEMAQAYLSPSPPTGKSFVNSSRPVKKKAKKTVKKVKPVKSRSQNLRSTPKLKKMKSLLKSNIATVKPHRHGVKEGVPENLLKDALVDLEKELRSLRASRRELEGEMEELTGKLGFTQSKEIALRNKISELMKNETQLEEKRSSLKDKFNEVLKRIEKVRTIEAQLKEV
ncbi:hypothetical protein HYX13_00195 [Candidatus Woesearchaeota archaeon]|nr:hypothetical protein [Candidatus Woesearchaeota archaeon]